MFITLEYISHFESDFKKKKKDKNKTKFGFRKDFSLAKKSAFLKISNNDRKIIPGASPANSRWALIVSLEVFNKEKGKQDFGAHLFIGFIIIKTQN